MKNYFTCLWYNTKLAYRTWLALKWNNNGKTPKVKVFVIMTKNKELQHFINGNGEIPVVTNFTKYEVAKITTMFPRVDEAELILMKAEHDALNDNLI